MVLLHIINHNTITTTKNTEFFIAATLHTRSTTINHQISQKQDWWPHVIIGVYVAIIHIINDTKGKNWKIISMVPTMTSKLAVSELGQNGLEKQKQKQ